MKVFTRMAAIACCALVAAAIVVPGTAGSGQASPSIENRPRINLAMPAAVSTTWSASNWSGYAESGTFTGASARWTVPAVAPSASPTYSSTWTGVDGFANSSLIQAGTEQDYYAGSAHYSAWWEILPAPETQLSTVADPVLPGDRMQASIWETSSTAVVGAAKTTVHIWKITLADITRGWTFTTAQPYSGPGRSAEWIHEAPLVGGAVSVLAKFSTAAPVGKGDFDYVGVRSTIMVGSVPTYRSAALSYKANAGAMVQKNVPVSTPGAPDPAKMAFNVAYGGGIPATPQA